MKFSSIKLLLLLTLGLSSFSSLAHSEERVLATVDGHPILQSEVDRMLGKKAKSEENQRKALDEVINDFLIQKAIQESNIKISERHIDNIVEDIAEQNGLTYGQFLDALDYQGLTLSQYRKQLRQQIMMDQVRQQTVGQSLQIDPQQVQSLAKQLMEKDEAAGKLKTANDVEYRISHILLKTNPILNDTQAKAKLVALTKAIQSNEMTFETAAENNSLDYVSGSEGGDLGWNFLENYDPAFSQVARKSKIGVISAPFKSQFGWHILKVTDTRKGDRTSDLYMQIAYQQLANKQAEAASQNWLEVLKNRANIQYLQ